MIHKTFTLTDEGTIRLAGGLINTRFLASSGLEAWLEKHVGVGSPFAISDKKPPHSAFAFALVGQHDERTDDEPEEDDDDDGAICYYANTREHWMGAPVTICKKALVQLFGEVPKQLFLSLL